MAIAEISRDSTPAEEPRGLRVRRTFTREGVHPYDEISWELRDAVIPGEGGNVFEQKGVEAPASWSQTATNVVASKFFRGKLGTARRETSVRQMIDRVVSHIARWGREGGYFASERDAAVFEDELRWLLVNQRMAFNSPVWFNVGASGERKAQGSAGFLLSGRGGPASGGVVLGGGGRCGAESIGGGETAGGAAKMVVLNADHPDVREFIWS